MPTAVRRLAGTMAHVSRDSGSAFPTSEPEPARASKPQLQFAECMDLVWLLIAVPASGKEATVCEAGLQELVLVFIVTTTQIYP